jgi:hypothetical protein
MGLHGIGDRVGGARDLFTPFADFTVAVAASEKTDNFVDQMAALETIAQLVDGFIHSVPGGIDF